MRIARTFKLLLATSAAVFLPLEQEVQMDHFSGSFRSQMRWSGLKLTDWKVEENHCSCWVRDVLGLPPDYFTRSTGPSLFGVTIGALPRNAHKVAVFHRLWEYAAEDEKPAVRAQAMLCMMENKGEVRDQMVEEAQRRWCSL